MCADPADLATPTPGDDRREHLRRAIKREEATLRRRIGVLVYRLCGRLRRDEVDERVREVLGDAASRALQKADRFDLRCSAVAWVMGIALKVLLEHRRGWKGRAVVQTDLGDAAWRGVLERLSPADGTEAEAIRLDIQEALAKLDDRQQTVVKLRYYRGLDGEELARAIDAPSAGAARVRLARALQALRAAFGVSGGQTNHE